MAHDHDHHHDHADCDCSDDPTNLLRQFGHAEPANDWAWGYLPSEVDLDVPPDLNPVRSLLRLMLVNLLKARGWPDSPLVAGWRGEVAACQQQAARRFTPEMRERIDVAALYTDARDLLAGDTPDGPPPLEFPSYVGTLAHGWASECPFGLEQLLHDDVAVLERGLTSASAGQAG
jgi:hypothetical protein